MAKQTVVVGDTGQQLVDKLANNFTELYSRPAQGEPGAGGSSGNAEDVRVSALNGMISDFLGEKPEIVTAIEYSAMMEQLQYPTLASGIYTTEVDTAFFHYKTAMRLVRASGNVYLDVLSVQISYNMTFTSANVVGGGFIRTTGVYSETGNWLARKVLDSQYNISFLPLPIFCEGNRIHNFPIPPATSTILTSNMLLTKLSLFDGIDTIESSTMWVRGDTTNSGGGGGSDASNVEYIYNYNFTEDTDNSSFVTGRDGVVFPNTIGGTTKRVQASKDIEGAKVTIEFTKDGFIWQDVTQGDFGYKQAQSDRNGLPNNLEYGVAIDRAYSNLMDVIFKSGGQYPSSGFGYQGYEWSGLHAQGYKWRVRVEYPQ